MCWWVVHRLQGRGSLNKEPSGFIVLLSFNFRLLRKPHISCFMWPFSLFFFHASCFTHFARYYIKNRYASVKIFQMKRSRVFYSVLREKRSFYGIDKKNEVKGMKSIQTFIAITLPTSVSCTTRGKNTYCQSNVHK